MSAIPPVNSHLVPPSVRRLVVSYRPAYVDRTREAAAAAIYNDGNRYINDSPLRVSSTVLFGGVSANPVLFFRKVNEALRELLKPLFLYVVDELKQKEIKSVNTIVIVNWFLTQSGGYSQMIENGLIAFPELVEASEGEVDQKDLEKLLNEMADMVEAIANELKTPSLCQNFREWVNQYLQSKENCKARKAIFAMIHEALVAFRHYEETNQDLILAESWDGQDLFEALIPHLPLLQRYHVSLSNQSVFEPAAIASIKKLWTMCERYDERGIPLLDADGISFPDYDAGIMNVFTFVAVLSRVAIKRVSDRIDVSVLMGWKNRYISDIAKRPNAMLKTRALYLAEEKIKIQAPLKPRMEFFSKFNGACEEILRAVIRYSQDNLHKAEIESKPLNELYEQLGTCVSKEWVLTQFKEVASLGEHFIELMSQEGMGVGQLEELTSLQNKQAMLFWIISDGLDVVDYDNNAMSAAFDSFLFNQNPKNRDLVLTEVKKVLSTFVYLASLSIDSPLLLHLGLVGLLRKLRECAPALKKHHVQLQDNPAFDTSDIPFLWHSFKEYDAGENLIKNKENFLALFDCSMEKYFRLIEALITAEIPGVVCHMTLQALQKYRNQYSSIK